MTAKHTPGPWTVSTSPDYFPDGATVIRGAGSDMLVRAVITDTLQRAANARLIAAAPELLAALERAADHLIMSGTKQTDAPEALAQARAAIAKAI